MISLRNIRVLLISILFLVSMTACSSIELGEPLIPVGDEQPGPGLFTGEDGEYKFNPDSKSVSINPEPERDVGDTDVDLEEASVVLEQKIRELEQQKKELEELKAKVDKKLQE